MKQLKIYKKIDRKTSFLLEIDVKFTLKKDFSEQK